ncbi:MAG: DUF2089 domain-containing protein [Chloroflexi bacterium]|nr:DUF2089 domain-containing protein [Chloroflexota bacterium]
MTTSEERLQILKMIENGRISAEEGARLLEALEKSTAKEGADQGSTPRRWFRVRVTDMRTGKPKVNVNIPLGLVSVGARMGARFAPEMSGIDVDEILKAVREGVQGRIIDVEDEDKGERVEIYAE